MVFVILLFSIKWLFQWNVAEREPAGTSENFKKFPVIFPVLREFDPGLFSWARPVGWAKAATAFH
jgi:hypothetical protein